MILVSILLLVCLYFFWYFDQKRRLRNMAHREQRKEALNDLLNKIGDTENRPADTNKNKE